MYLGNDGDIVAAITKRLIFVFFSRRTIGQLESWVGTYLRIQFSIFFHADFHFDVFYAGKMKIRNQGMFPLTVRFSCVAQKSLPEKLFDSDNSAIIPILLATRKVEQGPAAMSQMTLLFTMKWVRVYVRSSIIWFAVHAAPLRVHAVP